MPDTHPDIARKHEKEFMNLPEREDGIMYREHLQMVNGPDHEAEISSFLISKTFRLKLRARK